MKPPVDAPTSSASRPRTSTPKASSAFASLSPPRETYCGAPLDGERRLLVELLARLRHARNEPGEHERLRLRPALREPSLDEEHVGALLHRDKANGASRGGASARAVTDVAAPPSVPVPTISARHRRVAARSDRLERRERARGGVVRGLPRPGLAARPHRAVAVEQVVDRLEEHAELGRERAPRRLRRLGHLGRPQPAGDRRVEQPPGLQPVDRVLVDALAAEVEVLPADHPERRLRQLAGDAGRGVRQRQPERLREQRVARQHGHVLAEADVHRRPPAPLVVVVERGQVVVDERERVDELDGGRGRERALGLGAGRLRGREAEHRPHPLAPARERVPHGSSSPWSSGVSARSAR